MDWMADKEEGIAQEYILVTGLCIWKKADQKNSKNIK